MTLPSPATTREPRRDLLRGGSWVLLAFVASRLLVFGMVYLSRTVVISGEFWVEGGVLRVLTAGLGDGLIHVARYGYALGDHQLSMGFYPFYPWLVRAMAVIVRNHFVAAVVVSNLALLAAGLLLNALINLDRNEPKLNQAAAMFLMFAPLGVFFSSAYTESTFLMLSLAAILAARLDKWVVAAVCGMCLAATRNVGVFILVPLLIEYFTHHHRREAPVRSLLRPRLLLFLLVPVGSCYFLWEGYMRMPNPLVYWHANLVWGGTYASPRRALRIMRALPPFYLWLSAASTVIGVLLWAAGYFFKLRASYLAFAGVLILAAFCTRTPESVPRFLSIIFVLPLVVALAVQRWKWSYEPLLVASIMALTFCTVLRATGYWLV